MPRTRDAARSYAAGFQRQANNEQRHREREVVAEEIDAAQGDGVRRRAHDSAEQAGHGGPGQLSDAPGLRRLGRLGGRYTDDANGHAM